METRQPPMDVNRKFVRLIERRADGLVAFEFSIADPALYVEMLLPATAFEEFCEVNRVEVLDGPRDAEEAGSDWAWGLREATHQRFRQV